jgi:hypothetical protein
MQNKKSVGISFDKDILTRIDEERGEISRSKYLTKILGYNKREKLKNYADSLDLSMPSQ